MTQTLAISVSFLEGRYHGTGRWPPEPARLFQALLAGSAVGKDVPPSAVEALSWLEGLDAPRIVAPPARVAQKVTRWVPNNDADAELAKAKTYADAVAKVRTGKHEHPYLFDADRPIVYLWDLPGSVEVPKGLGSVVQSLFRLGRGADHAFASHQVFDIGALHSFEDAFTGRIYVPGPGDGSAVPCRGSLQSLIQRHTGFIERFRKTGRQVAFSQPPKPRFSQVSYERTPHHILFHLRRQDGSFFAMPLSHAAWLVDNVLRQAAERLSSAMPELSKLIDRQILGKDASSADIGCRVRLIPLPSVGHPDVDPSIRRLLLDIPPSCSLPFHDVLWAFETLSPHDPETGELLDWSLVRSDSRDTIVDHLTRHARVWRSLTPVVLPRMLKGRGGRERHASINAGASAVKQALRHAGVRAECVDVRLQSEPFSKRGMRADQFWRPERFGPGTQAGLAHVEIRLSEKVKGPLLLGNGRFRGLGLLAPVEESRGVFAASIVGQRDVNAETVAQAARRAVMARVARVHKGPLPTFFTGHGEDGAPARNGRRAHIGFFVDPQARVLAIVSPHVLNRAEPSGQERRHMETLQDALHGFEHLVAGPAGDFSLRPMNDLDTPMLSSARVWESVTDWHPCRHGKGDPASWVPAEIQRECHQRGLPRPETILLSLRVGKRGGISARLRLEFAVTVSGPVALGRTSMRGGGLFLGQP